METPNLPRLLTAKQLADQLSIPVWRVYELSRTGQIPVVHVGRSYRFSAQAIETWILNGGTNPREDDR